MIVNTMIGKSGGGGDVTVEATSVEIEEVSGQLYNYVKVYFPSVPAATGIKNLSLGGLTLGIRSGLTGTLEILSTSSNKWYTRTQAWNEDSGLSGGVAGTVEVVGNAIRFKGYAVESAELTNAKRVRLTYES